MERLKGGFSPSITRGGFLSLPQSLPVPVNPLPRSLSPPATTPSLEALCQNGRHELMMLSLFYLTSKFVIYVRHGVISVTTRLSCRRHTVKFISSIVPFKNGWCMLFVDDRVTRFVMSLLLFLFDYFTRCVDDM